MTTIDETANVDALIQQVMMNPAALIDRILRVVLQQLALDGSMPATSSASSEELIASSVGSWIGQTMNDDEGRGLPRPLAAEPITADHEELANRNSLLAAALGACDCWGEDVDCPFCEGHGGPAWAAPDRRLFAEFVYPAVRALSIQRRPLRPALAQGGKRGPR
jgi:hypothetical protein